MVANKLKVLRKQKGMTLEELAARLGTSKQTIHRYENGVIANIPKEKIEIIFYILPHVVEACAHFIGCSR
jgi:transcriptional regulator with XRE-family HTH domain